VSRHTVDFRKPTQIGARIDQDDEQLKLGKGYDHNFVLIKNKPSGLTLAASGRTTRDVYWKCGRGPGVQLYTEFSGWHDSR